MIIKNQTIKNGIKQIAVYLQLFRPLAIINNSYKRYKNTKGLKIKDAVKMSILTNLQDSNEFVNYSLQMKRIMSSNLVCRKYKFAYPFRAEYRRMLYPFRNRIVSVTPDYSKILESNIDIIKQDILQKGNDVFIKSELLLISGIEFLAKRQGLEHILKDKPRSLEDAIQKCLFYNGLFWQANHWHNGCGRLDYVLYPYYKSTVKNSDDRKIAKDLLTSMVLTLGKDTAAKSFSLPGDTGQYILLGGIDENGNNVDNDLTILFLEIISELRIPDPKVILRVNSRTSDEVWIKAIECLATGCGSPLIINEDVVMKGMVEFGYSKNDVWNFGTSACWEPLIIGKSFDQNNSLANIPVIKSLNALIMEDVDYSSFDELYNQLKIKVSEQITNSVKDLVFDVSPLFSLFFDDCINRNKDFTRGGAVYSWHGIQILSLPNLINALLNIKMYVFEQKIVTLEQCRKSLEANFQGYNDIRDLFLCNKLRYGSTDKRVISLTNDLQIFMSNVASKLKINGKKIKIGYSSSQYIIASRHIGASLDGRRNFEPFAVHISPVNQNIDIQEIIEFAGCLDYGANRMNGNVVDFILPPAFLSDKNKLITIIKYAMLKGFYELQLNVLDAKTLKKAKLHPEKYKELIVRVWGFSAYFNELPEEYKDNLIARAEAYA